MLRWKHMPKLAALLHSLAGILGAPEYQDRYEREMGRDIVQSGLSVQRGKGTAILSVVPMESSLPDHSQACQTQRSTRSVHWVSM